jgi:hypothetical protein
MRRLLTLIALLTASTIGWAKPLEIPKWAKPHTVTDAVMHPFAYYWFGTCGNGYSFTRQIKLQKATGSDLTNFPASIVGTYAPLKTAANGGQVQNVANNSISVSGPADLVFCDASSSGNPLKYEVAYYSATTGTFEIYVQIPTLHTASQDSIYMFVNNSGVVTTQQDLSLWADAFYTKVFHLADGSTLNVKSSTGGTQTNHSATASTGFIDGAGSFITLSSQYIDGGSANPVTTAVSAEAWIKRTANNVCNTILGNTDASGGYLFAWGNVGTCTSGAGLAMIVKGSGTDTGRYTTLDVAPAGQWTYVVGTFSGSGVVNVKGYFNGKDFGTGTTFNNGNMTATANNTLVGATNSATPTLFANGAIDEARERSTVSTPNWIATSYYYQSGRISPYQIIEPSPSYLTPTIAQMTVCASPDIAVGVGSCVMPFPVTSTGYLVYVLGQTDFDCTHTPTDGLGLTLTQQVIADFTGTLQHYYDCVYTAPVTATGADTITLPAGNYTALVMEVKGVTTSGVTTDHLNTATLPMALSATCGGTTCLLVCSDNLTNSTTGYDTYGNSQGYSEFISPDAGTLADDHRAQTYVATGVVASGAAPCTITGTGQAGTLLLLPVSPTATVPVRHRVMN